MNLKELKKEILLNNNNAIAFTIINYKTNYYSFSIFVKKIKNIIKENKIKNFDLLNFFNYLIEDNIINLNTYFDELIINEDLESLIINFINN